jgi:hypothetical protein
MKSLGFIPLGVVLLAGALGAQGKPVPPFQIPAIREPHHFVKLDNKYVRVLDVTVPGYDSTLCHIHENPYFWVSIEIIDIIKRDGEVSWSPEVIHRVGNVAATSFRNIRVQIQGKDDVSPGTSFSAAPKPGGYQHAAALDNELVHVERLILEPGQSTGKYTLPKSGILIAVHDGTVSVETPGLPPAKISLKAGDFDWHTGPLTHTITNTGPARFEAVEAVWK